MQRLALLCLCLVLVQGIDFDSFETCNDCIAAGFGWCPIKRVCGGFANKQCGEGERYVREKAGGGKGGKKKKSKKEKKPKEKKAKLDVKLLAEGNFTKVTESDIFWLVKFVDGADHGESAWKETAVALRNVAKVGTMDTSANPDFQGQTGVVGYFADKESPEVYTGALNSGGLVQWVFDNIKRTLDDRLAGL